MLRNTRFIFVDFFYLHFVYFSQQHAVPIVIYEQCLLTLNTLFHAPNIYMNLTFSLCRYILYIIK